ncbi:protein spinster isoform X3 [Diachasma alloeum]|uniref:protein spinster isoform X3 n=1 Tax=Diachasma alloeum TaxID=454923 RepID=UPI0007383D8E|nr:protein spinster isoform X3 [Diachasma alloeum]XP_015110237.1 protein spinster isoform X3 [Diachasma alloeum]
MENNGIPSNVSRQHLVVNDEPADNISGDDKGVEVMEDRRVSRKEWVTVVVLCFVNLINYMDRTTIPGILSDIQTEFHLGNDQSGLLQTAFIISYMIFAPLFGYLGDRYNRKIIMSAGVFLWCLTTLIGSYMKTYEWFLIFRMCVGIGEASYSTIAPTIISDLFVKDTRSKMLALFYFAIPVGSGLGYIIGGQVAVATGQWQWGLRITPALGLIAIALILLFVRDPVRGEREGGSHIASTTWGNDIRALIKNPSFMLSTAGFTCVAFVAGALALWAPKFLELGLKLQKEKTLVVDDISFVFGGIAMLAGLIGVPVGSIMAQRMRIRWHQADPLICGIGLLVSAPMIFFAIVTSSGNSIVCFVLIFLGQLALNLNWSIVADMLLYVVIPTRRSTAEAFQILVAHALGDAGSPYLIGVMSEGLRPYLLAPGEPTNDYVDFKCLQYSLFLTIFVEVLGALFFFLTALHIEKDKALVDLTIAVHEFLSSLELVPQKLED